MRALIDRVRPQPRRWEFWATQVLVIFIAGAHDYLEFVGEPHDMGMLYFIPISLFFVPVVYAALNFGFGGSAATAIWCTFLTIPNWVWGHEGLERWGVVLQLLIVIAVAVFVGMRVDRERLARREAEDARSALQVYGERHRGLFETSGEPVLVLDSVGTVQDLNDAARTFLGKQRSDLIGESLGSLVGDEEARQLLSGPQEEIPLDSEVRLEIPGRGSTWVEPVVSSIGGSGPESPRQLLLRNVTYHRLQRDGLRSLAAYILTAQEEERRRVARDLHDVTIQELIQVTRMIDDMDVPGDEPDGAGPRDRSSLRSAVEKVVSGIRGFAHDLGPPLLDDLGLIPAMHRLGEEAGARSGWSVTFEVSGPERRLSPEVEQGLFRIGQEALRNVERHAAASTVQMGLTFTGGDVTLTVEDDGVGFEPPVSAVRASAEGSLGLLGMEERARLVGGSLEIDSRPGKGATVIVTVPS